MDKNEFLEAIEQIGTCEDDVQRRTLLDNLRNNASTDYDNLADLTEKNTKLTSENEEIRSANMKLFLQLGAEKKSIEENPPNEIPGGKPEETKKREFEDLFDEKGGLK